jgi:hypothetical protein
MQQQQVPTKWYSSTGLLGVRLQITAVPPSAYINILHAHSLVMQQQQVPTKWYSSTGLLGVRIQITAVFILATVRTSDLPRILKHLCNEILTYLLTLIFYFPQSNQVKTI